MTNPTHESVTDTTVTPSKVLRDAAAYLLRLGWCQGDMFADPDQLAPPACALGAIHMALFYTPDPVTAEDFPEDVAAYGHAVAVFADHLILSGEALSYPDPADPEGMTEFDPAELVGDWNDDQNRIASHVIAALHGAADEWDRTRADAWPRTPSCCGRQLAEHVSSPDCSVFPGESMCVERVYRCPLCDRWQRVEVIDPAEKDRLFAVQAGGGA